MNPFFQFETDFVDNLRCIPMVVRYKLDTCGVKLKLSHWHSLSQSERQQLVTLPCNTPSEVTEYKLMLRGLIEQKTQQPLSELPIDPHPPWLDTQNIPPEILTKAADFGVTITLDQWLSLAPLQRFALLKLSRPSHENSNFYPAMLEFGLKS